MSKTNQQYIPGLKDVRKALEAIISKGYHSYKVFEDWVGLMFYAFQRDDPHYLEIMGQYRNTAPHGQREADYFAEATGALLAYMARTNQEGLGPLFMEFAASHYNGQFFTPESIASMMARINQTNIPTDRRFSILDPACGAGICLLAAAKEQTFEQNNQAFFVGQDKDLNCVRMTALNLMFFNLDGLIIWGNTLAVEVRGAWETRRSIAFGGSLRPADKEAAKKFIEGGLLRNAALQQRDSPQKATRENKAPHVEGQLSFF